MSLTGFEGKKTVRWRDNRCMATRNLLQAGYGMTTGLMAADPVVRQLLPPQSSRQIQERESSVCRDHVQIGRLLSRAQTSTDLERQEGREVRRRRNPGKATMPQERVKEAWRETRERP